MFIFSPTIFTSYYILKFSFLLTDSISGKSAVFFRFEELANETYWLSLQMLPDQEIHNFTLTGRNPLGQAESAIVINVTERGKPLLPARA